jgi:glycosyltransferase involved in cell wall biosynthesis
MPTLTLVLPGDLHNLTGGYLYDRHMVDGLRALGWQVGVLSLSTAFPWPEPADLAHADAALAALPDGHWVLADGLALGAMPQVVARHVPRLNWVALVHHPLAMETGLSPAQQAQLHASEAQALSHVQAVIVTSKATAGHLAAYGVPPERIQVILPGTAPAPVSPGSARAQPDEAVCCLCVATLTPRKGHAVLIEALARLTDANWQLHLVGSTTRDPHTAQAVHALIAQHDLAARVHVHGEVDHDSLQAWYARADVMVLPSFHEGYGMALAEALAAGVPVISTRTGAIPDTVPPDAGVLLPPGDVAAWQAALQRFMGDAAWRHALAAGALQVRAHLPTWAVGAAHLQTLLLALQAGSASAASLSNGPYPQDHP